VGRATDKVLVVAFMERRQVQGQQLEAASLTVPLQEVDPSLERPPWLEATLSRAGLATLERWEPWEVRGSLVLLLRLEVAFLLVKPHSLVELVASSERARLQVHQRVAVWTILTTSQST